MKKSELKSIIREEINKVLSEAKIAVVSDVKPSEVGWYVSDPRAKGQKIIKIGFYNKYPTGMLKDTLWTPRDLYADIDHGIYKFDGPKAEKYGVMRSSSNAGSFNDFFLKSKQKNIISLLKSKGYKIIRESINPKYYYEKVAQNIKKQVKGNMSEKDIIHLIYGQLKKDGNSKVAIKYYMNHPDFISDVLGALE